MGKDDTGAGQVVCGKKLFHERRRAILHRYALLGDGLPPTHRNNLPWFKEQWDRKCVEQHGNEWPDLFLAKLKGVLDAFVTDPGAFAKFMLDEERELFGGTRALYVPGRTGLTSGMQALN